jgi:D-3-phosphoglycerate dehydrogenase / 2-oxoglutarate reductase
MRRRVLISCVQMQRELPKFTDEFAARDIELVVPEVAQQLSEEELLAIMPDIDGVIVGDDQFTATVLESAPQLRILSKWGVGVDCIDLDAAARLGITVTNTPGVFADDVANVATCYLLMLARGLHRVDAAVRAGTWLKIEGESVREKVLGVVGLGSIGRALVVRGRALGMDVVGCDPSPAASAAAEAAGVRATTLEDVLAAADYLTLCCPLTPETHHLIDAKALSAMRFGAKLINVARGPIVDEPALIEALLAGQLAGAALDVYEVEPLPADSPLRDLPQVILGAHNGSNAKEAVERTSRLAVENLLAHLDPV